jgi:hypothetical protein
MLNGGAAAMTKVRVVSTIGVDAESCIVIWTV